MRTTDRRFAARALAAAVCAVALAAALVPVEGFPTGALERLARLSARGEQHRWRVRYAFTRRPEPRVAGAVLSDVLEVVHAPPLDVELGSAALTVDDGKRTVVCTDTGGTSVCLTVARPAGPVSRHAATTFAFAVHTGRYRIAQAAGRTIAGEATECFVLRHTRGELIAGLGTRVLECLTADGIPVLQQFERPGARDERRARLVARAVAPGWLHRLLAAHGYEPAARDPSP